MPDRLDLSALLLIGALGAGCLVLAGSNPPAQDCRPIEIIRWLEAPSVEGVSRTEWGRPREDWLQAFEEAPKSRPATIPAPPAEEAAEPAPEPRARHARRHWRHWRRWR